jgi:hypothetical protein
MPARRMIATVAGLSMLAIGCSTESPPVTVPELPPTDYGQGLLSAPGFTLVASGEVLIHPALTEQATDDAGGTAAGSAKQNRDYRPLFAGVKPAVQTADLALCHLEMPLADPNGPFTGYPSFSAPPEVAPALADLGYDSCSTASNHTLDKGVVGVARTLDTLDRANLRHTGSARSQQEATTPLLLNVRGVKVGHIAFSFGFNGIPIPPDKPWLANTLDADKVIEAARAARAAGAEVVVASLHWGAELQTEPTAEQRALARRVLADPAVDLIVGHHAHVVQPFEKIGGKWVAYGLGNHLARHQDPQGTTEEGVVARFQFRKSSAGWTVERVQYLPTLIDLGPPIRLLDLTIPNENNRDRRETAVKRIDEAVLSLGAGQQGLTRPGG